MAGAEMRVPDPQRCEVLRPGVRAARDEVAVGMGMAETDAEIVLHSMDLPPDRCVHYLVDDLAAATAWKKVPLSLEKLCATLSKRGSR
jgi:hypothetical protein